MKYLLSGFALCALTYFSACQSNSGNNSSTEVQQSADHTGHQHATTSAAQPAAQPATPPLVKEAAATIPAFKFYKVKSGIGFTNADVPKNRTTVFILFDPNCSHCQHEAGLLGKNYAKIKDINLYFVSMNDPALMVSFLETFAKELVDKPNVEILYDRNQEFIQKFHVPSQFPANYVYDSNNKLKSNWDGEKDIDVILAEYLK
ncbi:redoxin domain-containing protein [Sphingobacterium sp. LRF_L2]|uniref:redoxin domain-containing protein n=1 Tax=Sphingobacterium sp. LRF_L2 TaxID=3369421 RepID=UPI003F5E8A2F